MSNSETEALLLFRDLKINYIFVNIVNRCLAKVNMFLYERMHQTVTSTKRMFKSSLLKFIKQI